MKSSKTLRLSILLAIAAVLTAGSAYAETPAGQSDRPVTEQTAKCDDTQLSQAGAEAEIDAFFSSEYTYWDAAQLATYWEQSIDDAKARIGRKILWGPVDVAMLEQFLLDARLESLQLVDELRFYSETGYSYDDAAVLAEFWGEPSPYDAKLRIERNIIMGNAEEVDVALHLAAPEP